MKNVKIQNVENIQSSFIRVIQIKEQLEAMFPCQEMGNYILWKLNPSDRTITLTKLLIKHAKLPSKETKIGA